MSCVSLTKKRRGKYQRETTWFVAVDPKSDEFIANKCLLHRWKHLNEFLLNLVFSHRAILILLFFYCSSVHHHYYPLLVIDVQDTSCCDIYYGNNSVVVAKAQKGNTSCFCVLAFIAPTGQRVVIVWGGQKAPKYLPLTSVPRGFRVTFVPNLCPAAVWFIRFWDLATIFPACGFQSGWLQFLHESRKALAYLVHPLVLISFSNCGSSWNIYLDIQAFLDQNLCSISHVKLYWDIWTRRHRSCWRQNNSD